MTTELTDNLQNLNEVISLTGGASEAAEAIRNLNEVIKIEPQPKKKRGRKPKTLNESEITEKESDIEKKSKSLLHELIDSERKGDDNEVIDTRSVKVQQQ